MKNNYISTTEEIQSLHDVLSYLKPYTLVILDLDNTILKPSNLFDLGSDQWFHSLIAYGTQSRSSSVVLQDAVIIRNEIHALIEMQVVELNTLPLIKLLQHANVPLLIMTARGPSIITTTEKQLNNIGLKFCNEIHQQNLFFIYKNKSPTYQNGILYCEGLPKGEVWELFKPNIKNKIQTILMVDDNNHDIQSVRQANIDLEFIGLRYAYLDKKVAKFNATLCMEELMRFKDWLSSEAKDALMRLRMPAKNMLA